MSTQMDVGELREAARRVLDEHVDRRARYSAQKSDGDAELRELMAELGWMLLTTPEELDGLGQSFEALAPIYTELGRTLASVAFVGGMAAADALILARKLPRTDELLKSIGCGEIVVAIAVVETRTLSIEDQGTTVAVSGVLHDVFEGGLASHLLIVPAGNGELPVTLIDLSKKGVTVTDIATWDRTRNLATVQLDAAIGEILCTGTVAAQAGAAVRAHFDLALACDSLGGADQALAEAIAYMGTREQFNRPIGSFQALKHRVADLKVALEVARAFTNEACRIFAIRGDGWMSLAAQAKVITAEVYRGITEESVQFHGGIGVTWEHDCHLFMKRAFLNEMLGGTPEQYKDRVAPDIFRRAAHRRIDNNNR